MMQGIDLSALTQGVMEAMPANAIKTNLGADPQRLMRIFHDSLEAFEEGMKEGGEEEHKKLLREKGIHGLHALVLLRSLGVVV